MMIRALILTLLLSFGVAAAAETTATNSPVAAVSSVVKEKANDAVDHLAEKFNKVWNFQVFTVKGGAAPVTMGKIFIAVLALLVGFIVARRISLKVTQRIERQFSVDASRGEGLERIFFFFLFCLVAFTVLNWLEIPLTTFAFLGGALAIGVGFGAQNLVNNFISGLILLAERRIRVGDIIEVDSATAQTGTVVHLGTRCSRIAKGNGVEVLIPNSYFLEKNVANWTLTNSQHCYDFTVGLAYGTPVELVLTVLREAVVAEEKVLQTPPPAVFFESFGDSALIFHIYYWIDLRGTDNRLIGSNIRAHIDRLCREQKLALSSPARDVVLHTPAPLAVQLQPPLTEPRN